MSSIYDRTDIYDLLEDQTHWSAYKKHWKTLLQGKNVHSFLDVSIGSGSVTLPLCELGDSTCRFRFERRNDKKMQRKSFCGRI